MPDIKIPTVKEFKSLTGRSGVGKIFKTKNDLDPIFAALQVVDDTPPTSGDRAIAAARALRRACIAWLSAAGNGAANRASFAPVQDLLARANARFVATTEFRYFGSQSSSGTDVPIKNKPHLPFGRDITARSGNARDVVRVGNQLDDHLKDEMKSRHWGPTVAASMNQKYNQYKGGGGLLSIGAWADHIFLINAEDDPSGMYVGGGQVSDTLRREVREGVKYCTEQERASYAINIQAGVLQDASGTPYDTSSRETHFSGHGWAIFVLGFDNTLYSNTHIVNIFHHSSFFAGDPVQCGGELCCIGGKLRYLTNKTGHYKSGKFEFYRLLSFLKYQEVDLANVLVAPDIRTKEEFFRGTDVFNAHGGFPSTPPLLKSKPTRLNANGVPPWPIPPMTA